MCTLGKLIKHELTSEPIEGYRGWYIENSFTEIKGLFPLNQYTNIPFEKETESIAILDKIPFTESNSGFYAYNYNYRHNYYNNNYNYNNYNYYYNCNYYKVYGKVILSGRIAHHKLGYRATKARPSLLVTLTPTNINEQFNMFIEHFNITVKKVAEMYNIPTIESKDFK